MATERNEWEMASPSSMNQFPYRWPNLIVRQNIILSYTFLAPMSKTMKNIHSYCLICCQFFIWFVGWFSIRVSGLFNYNFIFVIFVLVHSAYNVYEDKAAQIHY